LVVQPIAWSLEEWYSHYFLGTRALAEPLTLQGFSKCAAYIMKWVNDIFDNF
jgi:hypothetical protein